MRITLESDYALRILTVLAQRGQVTDANTLSQETRVTPRFTLKILHKLVAADLAHSYKGVGGGYRLAADPSEISLRRVIECIDGPIAIARCLESAEECALNSDKTACAYHHIFHRISSELADRLEGITISDVISGSYHI